MRTLQTANESLGAFFCQNSLFAVIKNSENVGFAHTHQGPNAPEPLKVLVQLKVVGLKE